MVLLLLQQVFDGGFQLCRIFAPVAVGFHAESSDPAVVGSAPLVQCPVRVTELTIRPAMDNNCCLSRWCRYARNISITIEWPYYFDTKVDRHDLGIFVVIKEDVMTVGS